MVKGHTLIDEQKVQVVIHSLPQSWEHMKMHFTHNEGIKTLKDAMRHLELEEDCLMVNKTSFDVCMAGYNSHGGKWGKHKFHSGNKQESQTDARTKKKKGSTNQEKERIKTSLRKRIMCPSLSVTIMARRGILHLTAKNPRR